MRPAQIKNRFGKLLAARGISQTEFARQLGVRVSLVNYYCSKGIKTKRVAERYAAKLNCDPAELMEFESSHDMRSTPTEAPQ